MIRKYVERSLNEITGDRCDVLAIFDFDDTLVSSAAVIKILDPSGVEVRILTSEEFADPKNPKQLTAEEYNLGFYEDFSEFEDVKNPKLLPMFAELRKMVDDCGPDRVAILTARGPVSKPALESFFMEHLGLILKDIVTVGTKDPNAKAEKIVEFVNIYKPSVIHFYDDSIANIAAVENIARTHPDLVDKVEIHVHHVSTLNESALRDYVRGCLDESPPRTRRGKKYREVERERSELGSLGIFPEKEDRPQKDMITLYHMGDHPPQPVPKMKWFKEWDPKAVDHDTGERTGEYVNVEPDHHWRRSWLDSPVASGVFLTPNYREVALFHGKAGITHVFKVPQWVIKKSGGLHRYDRATEVLIPKEVWNEAGVKGKVYGKTGEIEYLGVKHESPKDVYDEIDYAEYRGSRRTGHRSKPGWMSTKEWQEYDTSRKKMSHLSGLRSSEDVEFNIRMMSPQERSEALAFFESEYPEVKGQNPPLEWEKTPGERKGFPTNIYSPSWGSRSGERNPKKDQEIMDLLRRYINESTIRDYVKMLLEFITVPSHSDNGGGDAPNDGDSGDDDDEVWLGDIIDLATGPWYEKKSDVIMSGIQPQLKQLYKVFVKELGYKPTITSAVRDEGKQADVMLDNWLRMGGGKKGTRYLKSLYKKLKANPKWLSEIDKALTSTKDNEERKELLTNILKRMSDAEIYVSRHFDGFAIDLRAKGKGKISRKIIEKILGDKKTWDSAKEAASNINAEFYWLEEFKPIHHFHISMKT